MDTRELRTGVTCIQLQRRTSVSSALSPQFPPDGNRAACNACIGACCQSRSEDRVVALSCKKLPKQLRVFGRTGTDLLHRYAGTLDDRYPLFDLGIDELAERRRR